MVALLVLSIASILNGLLGLIVYLKNPKSATHKLIFLLAVSLVLWSVVSYISISPALLPQIVWVRLTLFSAAFLCLAVFLTFTVFPAHHLVGSSRIRKAAIGYTAFVMALTLTPFVFSVNEEGVPAPAFGIGFFGILVITLLVGGVFNLIKKYTHSIGREKRQLQIVLFGVIGSFGLIFLTNFLLVVAFNYTNLIAFGPLYTLIFSGSFAYAIFKYRLFDIRTTIARSVAYLLLLSTLIAFYAAIVFSLSAFLFSGETISIGYRLANVAVAIFLAFTFPYLKNFFDHLTNRIFFRESYSSQEVIKALNDIFVSQVSLEAIMGRSMSVICNNLKISHARFIVLEKDSIYHTKTHGEPPGLYPDLADLRRLRGDLVDIDNLASDTKKQLLESYDINVGVRLRTHNDIVGYLLLGPKSTGSIYSAQDLDLLQIMSKELAIAVESALSFEEIREFNRTLQDKVEEATARLRRTNARLRELDDAKDEFVSMASHQLRTPLTSVKGYLSMVLEGDAGRLTKDQKKLLEEAYNGSQRMVYLIGDFLNVSRIKTGKFMLEFTESNLAEVVGEEVGQLRVTAENRNLKFIYEAPEKFPAVRLDENKIRQVAMNLIDNAIFYTKPGGTIRVELYVEDGHIVFRVRDDGIGVPAKEQKGLFEKFYRAENARKVRPDGTGLGLFMIKKVVLAHGGSIMFESKEGKGSTFGFRLPVKSQTSQQTASPQTKTVSPRRNILVKEN